MDDIKQMAKTVAKCIKGDTKKTKAYDTAAKVKRIENGTAYVEIPGGVSETPVKLTIDAKVGDDVQVHVGNGTAWLVGNQSAPPTDDAEALKAKKMANTALDDATRARQAADSAEAAAQTAEGYAIAAKQTTDEINAYATTAGKTVTQILNDGETAGTAAQEAKQSAENASEYAARALGNLSTVQSVAETLTWITQHGTMALTQDQQLDPTHVYFVVDAGGDYTVGGVTYAIVTEPDVADIGTYYELSIDESLNNYVGTHLALDSEGLWLLPATSGTNKVLIATGAGSTYTTAGTYLIDSSDNVVASFRADGATMSAQGVQIAHLGYGDGTSSGGGTSKAPYYTLGRRSNNSVVGNYSMAEGVGNTASGYVSHAEGNATKASAPESHAEGDFTTASYIACHAEGISTEASGRGSHAEGTATEASGDRSHAQNNNTIAQRKSQTALGEYNIADTGGTDKTTRGDYALIIGNGTSDNARSNALEVTWAGDVKAYGDIEDGSGNVLANKADASAIPTVNDATLTIQKNGTNVETFTANASSNKTANITVPTNTSDLVNNSGFIAEDSSGDISITRNITAGGDVTANNIGTWNPHTPSATSCTTGRYFQVAYVTLDAGIWLIDQNAYFPATNTTGTRQILCTTATSGYNNVTTAPASYGNITRDTLVGANNNQYPQAHFPVNISATTTFRLIAYQNSGTTMSVVGRMYAIRIK